jgi:hypothetical protein
MGTFQVLRAAPQSPEDRASEASRSAPLNKMTACHDGWGQHRNLQSGKTLYSTASAQLRASPIVCRLDIENKRIFCEFSGISKKEGKSDLLEAEGIARMCQLIQDVRAMCEALGN